MDKVALRSCVVENVFDIGGVLLGFYMSKVLLDLDVFGVVLGLGCVEVGLGTSVVVSMPSLTGDS